MKRPILKVIVIILLSTLCLTLNAQESQSKLGFEIQPISASHIHFYKSKSQNHQLSLSTSFTYTMIKSNYNWILGLNAAITAFEYSNLNFRYGLFIHQSRNFGGSFMHQYGTGINYSSVTVSTNNFIVVDDEIIDIGKINYKHFNPTLEYRVGVYVGKNQNIKIQIPIKFEFLYPFRDGISRVLKADVFYGLNFHLNLSK